MFEDLGGRDEDAERAYLDGVARSNLYIGVVADRYGTMLATGRSPTHEEYLEVGRRGKRISSGCNTATSVREQEAMPRKPNALRATLPAYGRPARRSRCRVSRNTHPMK